MTEDFQIHPAARDEFHDTLRYFGSIDLVQKSKLAFDFEAVFFDYVDVILANPRLYNLRQHSTRRVNLLPRFGEYYIAAHMIWLEKVVILAVAHAKRRPHYWRDRITQAKEHFNS